MCTVRKPEAAPLSAQRYAGAVCPACNSSSSRIDYMRFLDPHGVERIDYDIFECSERRHTFVLAEDGLRLLAADGQRVRDRKIFAIA